ncbi:MAG: polymerase, sigma-24 subunit, subfamily [Solirubrobacterales bacterium]|nr:polymerase, sigma-24 subunit, subfamily [Solirubrobacterales bacterium]
MSPRIPTRLLATQSDQRLVELARRGHERAFEAVVHRYRRPLLRYCARMGLSEGAAEDVLQQGLLRAWLALERRVEVRELRPWLYRIVHNTAVNALRSSRDDHHAPAEDFNGLAAEGAESELERRIALRDALSGVAALPHMQREAIVLTAFAGGSHDEVADVLGVTDGAVRGLLYRARTTLRGAAAAITPQPLISWACGAGAAAPPAERLAELSAPVGAAGMVGVLAKSAAVAVTAAVVVTGTAVVAPHRHPAHRSNGGTVSAGIASKTSERLIALSSPPPVALGGPGAGSGRGGRGAERLAGSGKGSRSAKVDSAASRSEARHSQDGRGSGDRSGGAGSDHAALGGSSDTRVSSGPSGGGGDGSGASGLRSGDSVRPQGDGAAVSSGGRSGSDGSGGSDGARQPPTTAESPQAAAGGGQLIAEAPLASSTPPPD